MGPFQSYGCQKSKERDKIDKLANLSANVEV